MQIKKINIDNKIRNYIKKSWNYYTYEQTVNDIYCLMSVRMLTITPIDFF